MGTEVSGVAVGRPVRGTRPANRRALILAAAADLFYRNGYGQVSMKDIAEAVAIGPSALYRHFAGKEELLSAVVADALAVVDDLLERLLAEPGIEPTAAIAQTMIEHRGIGKLWHSEARHLPDDSRTRLRGQLRAIGARLARLVQRQRPGIDDIAADLLAWCILAVATSVSFHSVVLPGGRFVDVLADMIRAVTFMTVPRLQRISTPIAATDGVWAPNRRAAILTSATKLFAHRGFSTVGMEDIGASVGIAGPSVYNHFAAKEEILTAAITRGGDLLTADMHRQLGRARNPHDALKRLLVGYAEYVFENPEAIQLLISEVEHLPARANEWARAVQHEYITVWMGLLRQVTPDVDALEARVRVQAALGVVNDVASTKHLRAFANADTASIAAGAAVLGIG